MTVLSDTTLRRRIETDAHDLDVTPIEDGQIQPASIDLRLSPEAIDVTTDHRFEADAITFRPGDFYLCSTIETITLPADMCGTVYGRSSIGRLGVQVENAGFVDPLFSGQITLEVVNMSPDPVTIPAGRGVCQLVVRRLDQACGVGYEQKGGNYQGQTGPTRSVMENTK